jgi:cell division protein FtsA
VEAMILQPLASAKAVLSKDEKDLGVALIDIGGGTTDIAIFHGGSIVHTAVLPLGGAHITQDLAIGLKTPHTEAEKLKIQSGCALKQMISASETVEVPSVGGRPARIVDRKLLGEIIEPRLEEILQMANREIIASRCAEILGGGVVLTGGTTMMEGIVELAEFVFDLPVKRAYPENLSGFSDMVRSPAYSTAIGLALWGADSRSGIQRRTGNRANNIGKMKDQLKNFLSDMF